jgi:replicative superfamily II helicase
MADRVIIVDVHRAGEKIPIHEIKQQQGRAGRKQSGGGGRADVILGMTKLEEHILDSNSSDRLMVKSNLNQELDDISFHVLAEISTNKIKNTKDIYEWYKRSLHSYQGNNIDAEIIVEYLKKYEAIRIIGESIQPTLQGLTSSKFYFSPKKIWYWSCNFKEIIKRDICSEDFSVIWALANTDEAEQGFIPKELTELVDEYVSQVHNLSLVSESTIRRGLSWWNLLGGPPIRSLKVESLEKKKEWARIYRILRLLNRYKKWNKLAFLSDLNTRIEHRLPSYLINLSKMGFTKAESMELYNMGIDCIEEIDFRIGDIESTDNQKMFEKARKLIHDKLPTKSD